MGIKHNTVGTYERFQFDPNLGLEFDTEDEDYESALEDYFGGVLSNIEISQSGTYIAGENECLLLEHVD